MPYRNMGETFRDNKTTTCAKLQNVLLLTMKTVEA